ncbi:MAG: DNA-protecting protein DprA [Hyphomicrobiales bacterium]|nr:DNA-protecting protein DprA [Hyphomicrobiales bacterium]
MTTSEAGRKTLSHEERLDWMRLTRSENVGPVTFRKLLRRFGTARQALEMLPEMSRRGGSAKPLRICRPEDAERELAQATELGYRLIGLKEPEFPPALRAADGAPPILTVKGNAAILTRPAVAIVGSRNASALGCKITHRLAMGIGQAGYSIVSGLARGIDAAAHEAALESGTVAVMAGGLDKPYPPQNIPLLESICQSEHSAAVSEMPLGWEPRARDFPRRNRIIAGISLGLVVVEATKKSGSLISARIAGELGRIVFAVPGSPLDLRAKGTNDLIRDGAILTGSADDVLEALAPLAGQPACDRQLPLVLEEDIPASQESAPTDSVRARIAGALGPAPIGIDDLVRHTELPPAEVYLVLLELDLAGRLARHPGGCVSLLPGRSG